MNEPLLEKMGGERVCSICGYVEREVFRLFCPHCMQRDRLSTLVPLEESHRTVPYSADPNLAKPMQGVSV